MRPMYAHATIELADGRKFQRGDEIPRDFATDLPGMSELVEAGSVRDEPYDPANEPTQTPDTVEIDGVVYVKAADAAEGVSDAGAA